MAGKITNKEKFRRALRVFEIEIFSYCNRTCWFCPNSFIDRRTENKQMPEVDYLEAITQLRAIDYSGEVTYSRYNEPLSHRELFITRVKQAREILPKATLKTNTNGDYVTRDYIEELCDIGFNQLWIQQYLGNDERYDHPKMLDRIQRKIKKLGLPAQLLTDVEGSRIEYDLSHRGMTIHIRARNFEQDGSSRGCSVPIAQDYQRTQKCLQPFHNMYVDHNGAVMVCCALRSDVEGHASGIMGNLKDGKLWDIHAGENYKAWRNHHLTDGPKTGHCKTCRDNVKA